MNANQNNHRPEFCAESQPWVVIRAGGFLLEVVMSTDELVLRVIDWDELFENNRTRALKTMGWVPIPNKHDGDGYTELIEHPSGPVHYACWVTIVQVASRCRPRGTLLRSIKHSHDSASLSRITRIPVDFFDEAIPRLITIAWLERIPLLDIDLDAERQVDVRATSGRRHLAALKGREGKERKKGSSSFQDNEFEKEKRKTR